MPKAHVTATGAVAELVISAPPLNLFDGEMTAGLEPALSELTALFATRDLPAGITSLLEKGPRQASSEGR